MAVVSLSATQQKLLDNYTTAANRFLALIEPLSESELDRIEEPGGWSIRQIVHHVSDDGDAWAFQMKRAIATPGAPARFECFPGNEVWAAALNFAERAIGPDLVLIHAHNRAMAALAADFPHEWQCSVTIQAENGQPAGSVSVSDMLTFLTAHLQEHTETIARILDHRENRKA